MYNKIFTKILDSSIWLESNPTRIVWFTFLAAMDETGFAQFASVANLAHRARVTTEEAQSAVDCLSGPDSNSSDPDNEGRRIERVQGGWMVLNAEKYRAIVTRAVAQEKTRVRVANFRASKKVTPVTKCNGRVTPANESVTPSEAETKTKSDTNKDQIIPDSSYEEVPKPQTETDRLIRNARKVCEGIYVDSDGKVFSPGPDLQRALDVAHEKGRVTLKDMLPEFAGELEDKPF